MPGKTALRLVQLALCLTVVLVVAFGRKSPNAILPASIEGEPHVQDNSEFVLRRRPDQRALPYSRKLIDVFPQASATPIPGQANSAEIHRERQVRRHRIVEGDTIQSLAQLYLGDSRRFMEIVLANGLTHPEILPLGRYLIIPPIAAASRPAASLGTPSYLPESPRPLLPVR